MKPIRSRLSKFSKAGWVAIETNMTPRNENLKPIPSFNAVCWRDPQAVNGINRLPSWRILLKTYATIING
jgi:hypothetical protein